MLAKELLNGQPGTWTRCHTGTRRLYTVDVDYAECWPLLKEGCVRPLGRHQHLGLPVPQQAEVCGLQEEAHDPWLQGITRSERVAGKWPCVLGHVSAGTEELQPATGTFPLPSTLQDPLAHHPRHGALESQRCKACRASRVH